jgi:hypothetical protein
MTATHEEKVKVRAIKQRFIKAAAAELGYSETGDNHTKFGVWYGLDHQPWCGMFVSWAAKEAHVTSIVPKYAYTPAGADFFKKDGQWFDAPKVGDIVFFDTAGLGRISHTGIVTKVNDDGTFETIEGNTNAAGSREGTSVQRKHRTTVGPKGGFGRPRYLRLARKELAK